MIACELFVHARQGHAEQIHTGFVQLHRRGVVRLRQSLLRRPVQWVGLRARIDDRVSVYYDLNDDASLYEEMLDEVDCYFKRSFVEDHRRRSDKIHPLGLNYPVYSEGIDLFRTWRELALGPTWSRVKGLTRQVFKNFPTSRHIESLPDLSGPPKILLLTKLWSYRLRDHPKASKSALEVLDRNRVECVRLLRKEFADLFFGGIAADPWACERYGDVVLEDPRVSQKKRYMKLLREFPICVTTRGLWESNGFRLGEYVAQGKAIATESLAYRVPGDFANGKNYLEFSTPEECVEVTRRLVEDRELRQRLSMNNFRYYRSYVRPDSLVLNSLAVALSR